MAGKVDEYQARVCALELAVGGDRNRDEATTEGHVHRAEAFLAFLLGTAAPAALAKPVTASPLAEPDGSVPARLDAPEVKAEAAAEIAAVEAEPATSGPTLAGDTPAATTADPAPAGSETKPSPSAPAADSPAPTADGKVPLDKLNSAVLAAVKEPSVGKPKVVETLNAHGGGTVPAVPVENHPALFAALNALLPADKRVTL